MNYYDNGVVGADEMIGGIIDVLQAKGYLDDALVVVTSDHGEALGEHGVYGHANPHVYNPVLRVPLLLFDFGGSEEPLDLDATRIASVVDVAPTILRELRIPPPSSWIGEALQDPSDRRFILFQQGALVGLLDGTLEGGPWKFWVDTRSGTTSAFNLSVDPDERCNLAGALPPPVIETWLSELAASGPLHLLERGDIATRPDPMETGAACEQALATAARVRSGM